MYQVLQKKQLYFENLNSRFGSSVDSFRSLRSSLYVTREIDPNTQNPMFDQKRLHSGMKKGSLMGPSIKDVRLTPSPEVLPNPDNFGHGGGRGGRRFRTSEIEKMKNCLFSLF